MESAMRTHEPARMSALLDQGNRPLSELQARNRRRWRVRRSALRAASPVCPVHGSGKPCRKVLHGPPDSSQDHTLPLASRVSGKYPLESCARVVRYDHHQMRGRDRTSNCTCQRSGFQYLPTQLRPHFQSRAVDCARQVDHRVSGVGSSRQGQ